MNWLRRLLHRFIRTQIEIQISEFMRKENDVSMGINFSKFDMRDLDKEESKKYMKQLKKKSKDDITSLPFQRPKPLPPSTRILRS